MGEPEDVDPSKTATVSLAMHNVRDSAAFAFRDADTGDTLDPSAVKVAPGDVRFITVGR